MNSSVFPRLPVELIEEITQLFWTDDSLGLSPEERVTFINSSLLINRSWSSLKFPLLNFLSIASRDVYIQIPVFAFQLRNALKLQLQTQANSKNAKPAQYRTTDSSSSSTSFSLCSSLAMLMPSRCHSLTFQYAGTKHPSDLFVQEHYYEHSLIGSSVLAMLQCLTPPLPLLSTSVFSVPNTPSLTPHLRSISVDFHSCTAPSLFTYYKFHPSCFPPQVSSLSIHFHYSSIPPSIIEQEFLLDETDTEVREGLLEGVKELRLFRYSAAVVRDMVQACPAIAALPIRLVLARQRAIDKFYARREAREIHLEAHRQIARQAREIHLEAQRQIARQAREMRFTSKLKDKLHHEKLERSTSKLEYPEGEMEESSQCRWVGRNRWGIELENGKERKRGSGLDTEI
ncbi:hypothetical protein K435DRAFT_875522 [Dendrothele bispora CBS 962.96]|uniref:Uncharacterized protein n=1 Tax=Dendrothele bispora (strain CBS 962.96) TaxID=1314807 RepID=A0A4S8KU33_DENBC|nr:hypothetical protein K435DRAFT_875522 [Dendrothele bispora CBS 962.96]